jgi:hypothetical protein
MSLPLAKLSLFVRGWAREARPPHAVFRNGTVICRLSLFFTFFPRKKTRVFFMKKSKKKIL